MYADRRVSKILTYTIIALLFISIYTAPTHTSYRLDNKIEVYFLPTDAGKAIDRIVELIDNAKDYVYVAVYLFNLEEIGKALGRAFDRGVDVRIVSDSETLDENPPIKSLMKKGVPVRLDNRDHAIMHNKFIVIDDEIVITGSANFKDTEFFRNNNDLLIIHSRSLAINYKTEFLELYSGLYGRGKQTDVTTIKQDSIVIENYFSPEDPIVQRLTKLIKNASKTIYFAAFVFTDKDIADALVYAREKGVIVYGVIESYNVREGSDTYNIYEYLRDHGVAVKKDMNKYTMHLKLIIIDNETVITGSYNPTYSARTRNDENIVIIHSREIAQVYAKWFLDKIYPGVITLRIKVVDQNNNPLVGARITITNIDRGSTIIVETDSNGTYTNIFPDWKPGEKVRIYVTYGALMPASTLKVITLKNGLNPVNITIEYNPLIVALTIIVPVLVITIPPLFYKLVIAKKKRSKRE